MVQMNLFVRQEQRRDIQNRCADMVVHNEEQPLLTPVQPVCSKEDRGQPKTNK